MGEGMNYYKCEDCHRAADIRRIAEILVWECIGMATLCKSLDSTDNPNDLADARSVANKCHAGSVEFLKANRTLLESYGVDFKRDPFI
jgi:hypothetical protein